MDRQTDVITAITGVIRPDAQCKIIVQTTISTVEQGSALHPFHVSLN